MEMTYDLVNYFDNDLALLIMESLDVIDVIRAVAVSKSWSRFVIANGLCKKEFLKRFPHVTQFFCEKEGIRHFIRLSDDLTVDDADWADLERDHRIYSSLLQPLAKPMDRQTDCLSYPLAASSARGIAQNVLNILNPAVGDRLLWCSEGKADPEVPEHSQSGRSKAEVQGVYKNMASFEFVFTLHLMHRIMRVTDSLCQILQRKVQDILAAITFVSTTKTILKELRECGWEGFLEEVKVFCSRNGIDVPKLECAYKVGRSRGQTTMEHHYHFDVFNGVIDCILMELDTRFNDASVELLSLSVALDPKNSFESFNIDNICRLARKFYPEDFTGQDIVTLEYELDQYKRDVIVNQEFQVSTLVELSQLFSKSGRSKVYVVLTRLIHLVLTLPISTATTERTFSAMKHVKTALRNKMGDDLLGDCLMLYIERDFVKNIEIDSIIDEFYVLKSRRAQLK